MEKKIIIMTDGNEDLLNTLIEKGIFQLADEDTEEIDPGQRTLFDDPEGNHQDKDELEDDDESSEGDDEEEDTMESKNALCLDMLDEVDDRLSLLKSNYEELVRSRMYIHVMRDMPKDISHLLNALNIYDQFIELDIERRKLENQVNMTGFISEYSDEEVCENICRLKDDLHSLDTCMTPIMSMLSVKCGLLFDPDTGFTVTIESEDDEKYLDGICHKALLEANDMLTQVHGQIDTLSQDLPKENCFNKMFISSPKDVEDSYGYMMILNKIIDTEIGMAQAINRVNFARCFILDGESVELDKAIDCINEVNSVLVPLKVFMDEKFEMEFQYIDEPGLYAGFIEEDED